MKRFTVLLICVLFVLSTCLSACSEENVQDSRQTDSQSSTDNNAGQKEADGESTADSTSKPAPETDASGNLVNNSEVLLFSNTESINETEFDLQILLPAGKTGEIHYTLTGKEPTKEDTLYSGPIHIEEKKEAYGFPQGTVVFAKAFYSDGTEEKIVKTYFVSSKAKSFFNNYVFLITADPADITEATGILSNDSTIVSGVKNYDVHGDISERAAHVEVLTEECETVVDMFCGVRVHGAYNRRNEVKSLKLIADKKYDENNKNFKYDFFGNTDWSGEAIEKYSKLVLRSYGNDFGQAYIRDELNMRLAKDAGFDIYEEVTPAFVYINGEFYNYTWLHENYCNKYFKNKFPNEDAKGKFEVIEGTDRKKNYDEDGGDEELVDEYNALYEKYSSMELTDDVLVELNSKIDVYGYLDYFAFNTYINNNDWPHNNFKCMKYVAAEGEEKGEDYYDGRWYYLLHDMDYTEAQYWQARCQANHNNLHWIMTDEEEIERSEWWGQVMESSTGINHYSPLFTNMMKRDDLRNYFIKKVLEYGSTVCNYTYVTKTLTEMRLEQSALDFYMNYLSKMYSREAFYKDSQELIKSFCQERYDYMVTFMAQEFNMDEQTVRSLGEQ